MRNAATSNDRLIPSRMATPPPAIRVNRASLAPSLPAAIVRSMVTLVAMALVFVVVVLLDRVLAPASPDALPLWTIALAGFGAAFVSATLRRAGVSRQMPSRCRRDAPRTEQATHHEARDDQARGGRATAFPGTSRRRGAAQVHDRGTIALRRRPLLGILAALAAASLMLALVLQNPYSASVLAGIGLTGILALRLFSAPRRAWPSCVAEPG